MLRLLAPLLSVFVLPLSAAAQDNVAQVQLLDGWHEDDRRVAGLEIALDPGWKTYWRAPGRAGIPPHFDWTGSQNVDRVEVHWPVPEVFDQGGMTAVGYGDRVVLPLEITPIDPGAPVTLALTLEMGVCQDICVPVQAHARGDLHGTDDGRDALIRDALADRPLTAAEAGVAGLNCEITPTSDGMRVTTRLRMPPVGPAEYGVTELADPRMWVSGTDLRRRGDDLVAVTEIAAPRGEALAISREALRLTVLGGNGAVEIRGCG